MVKYVYFVLALILWVGATCRGRQEPPVRIQADESDDFCDALGGEWTMVDPLSAGTFAIQGDTVLSLAVSHGSTPLDMYTGNPPNTSHMYLAITDADFTLVVKAHSTVDPGSSSPDIYDGFGPYVRLGSESQFIRHGVYYDGAAGGNQKVFRTLINGASASNTASANWNQDEPLWFRITYTESSGEFVTDYSADGTNWTTLGATITTALNPDGVGLYALDASATGGIAYTALFDYISLNGAVNGDESSCAGGAPTSFRWGNLVQ
jgi:hypothetical protein